MDPEILNFVKKAALRKLIQWMGVEKRTFKFKEELVSLIV